RPRVGRLEPARHLVLALRAGLEVLQPIFDAVLDPLVVARFEMQAVELRSRAPVAAVQRVVAAQEDRRRDRSITICGEFHHDGLRQELGNPYEEFGAQIVLVAARLERVLGEREYRAPQGGIQLISMQGAKADACFLDAAPLSQRLLALVRAKSGDEILEGAIAPVVPMELAVVPRKKTGLHEQRELLRRGEKNVYRRAGAGFGVLHQRLDQLRTYGGPILAASREQPRARNRGERHHADERSEE